ncbi:MAG: hypothetical protein AABZ92_02640, partial [Verrucomicrobiota bacterium]
LLEDLKTLQTIFNAGHINLIEPMRKFLKPLKIYTSAKDLNVSNAVSISVTLEEFTLIGVFNGGNLKI